MDLVAGVSLDSRGLHGIIGAMYVPLQRLDVGLPVPMRAHPGDGGLDLHARSDFALQPGEWSTVPTGIAVAIPEGFAGLVTPRSGLAARHGVGVANAPGLVDAGYRGEVKVIMVNHGVEPVDISRGDRIAQLVIVPIPEWDFEEVEELPESVRGEGGFGSTGS